MWDPYADFEKVVLPNGLEVYVAHWENRPWIKAGFVVHAASGQDEVGKEGTAHFLEHLVSVNTTLSRSEMEDYFYYENGGSVNFGTTSFLATWYKFAVPSNDSILLNGLNYFADMLLNSCIDNCIESERHVIQQEILEKFPMQWVVDVYLRKQQSVYKGYFFERFISAFGSAQSVDAITQKDLQCFFDHYYIPSNMSLIFVGGMAVDEIYNIISQTAFAQDCSGNRNALPEVVSQIEPLTQHYHQCLLSEKGFDNINQSFYRSTSKLPKGEFGEGICMILKDMLNEIFSEEVRQKRSLAYSFESNFRDLSYFYEFNIEGNIRSGSEKEVSDIVKTTLANFHQHEKLFDKSRKALYNNYQMLDVDGASLLNDAINDIAKQGKISSIQENLDDLSRVGFHDMLELVEYLAIKYRFEYIQMP